MIVRLAWLAVVFLASPIGYGQDLDQQLGAPLNLDGVTLSLTYANDFSGNDLIDREDEMIAGGRRKRVPHPNASWVAEGWGGSDVCGGKLWVAPSAFKFCGERPETFAGEPSNMVIWNSTLFPADILLEFTVNHHGSDNGLTLVFFAARGPDGQDIFDLDLPLRRAEYKKYNRGLANYTVSYWSRNQHKNAIKNRERYSNRVRRNAGMNLLALNPSQTDVCSQCDYHIRILKIEDSITVAVNGVVVNYLREKQKPLESGYIGLRSMRGIKKVSYDDFRVWVARSKEKDEV